MNLSRRFDVTQLVDFRWGAQCLTSLYISVISGIIVAFQYDLNTPYYSTGSLDVVIPFGLFWRSLHYYSSQFFFVLLLIHLIVVLFDNRMGNQKVQTGGDPGEDQNSRHIAVGYLQNAGKWMLLTLSIPVSALVLFTGYILRFDSTGESAGYIAENITRSIPLLGGWLNGILFNITSAGLKVVYVNHVIGLGCLWGYLVWSHLRKYRVKMTENGSLVVLILGLSYSLPAPIEPPWPGNFHILGPWFFIGLQELLRYVHPFMAGIIFPVVGLSLLILAVNDEGRRGWPMQGIIAWSAVYTLLTIIGWIG